MQFILSVAILFSAIHAAFSAEPNRYWAYIGTYTGPNSKGIYVCKFNAQTGQTSSPELAGECANPSFLAVHPNGKFLYAANEVQTFQGAKTGALTAFAIQADGKLTQLNQVSSLGADPCHVMLDKSGQSIFVANYSSGNIAVYRVNADGTIGAKTAFDQHKGSSVVLPRQSGPLAHCVVLDPANKFLLSADLGMDKVMIYKFDKAVGTITPNDPPFAAVKPGAGPRHIAFTPNAKQAYVINEMNSTLISFAYDAQRGALKELQTVSTLPADFTGDNNSTAEIAVHPSGKFVYGSNRGHNSIAVFQINQEDGTLTLKQHQSTQGKIPRNFEIDPTGKYLFAANQDTHNIAIFRIDPATGKLEPTGGTIAAPSPVCVKFVPAL